MRPGRGPARSISTGREPGCGPKKSPRPGRRLFFVADLVADFFCQRPGRRPGLRQIFVGDLVCDLVYDKFDLMEFRYNHAKFSRARSNDV